MTKKLKRIHKLLSTQGDLDFRLVKKVLMDHGFFVRRIQGSHFQFHNSIDRRITLAVHKNTIKKIYKEYIINALYENY